jgi:hypothetical protein
VGIRETLNEKPAIGIGIAAGVILIAAVVVIWQFTGRSSGPALTAPVTGDQAYYTDDDGKTFFADDSKKMTPFKHSGKDAYRAHVYKCSKGEPFVGYIERHTDYGKQQKGISLEMGSRPSFSDNALFEIKKPGKNPWVPVDSKHYNDALQVMGVPCPGNANENPLPIIPGQPT